MLDCENQIMERKGCHEVRMRNNNFPAFQALLARSLLYALIYVSIALPSTVYAQTGSLEGTVVDARTLEPLVGVNITIKGEIYGAATNMDGRYAIYGIDAGIYTVLYSMIGYEQVVETDVLIRGSRSTIKNLELSQSVVESSDEVTVTAYSYFERDEEIPVSYRNLSYEEVRRSPGAREDVSRMVQNLPGITPTTDDRNDLVVRGGSPAEVLYRVDGIEIPNPNHFPTQGATGGPISMLNTQFIEEVSFLAGGFPARYGHKMSGVLDIQYREGNSQSFNGKFDLNFAGAGGNFEGPIGDGSWMLAFHRSFLDVMEGVLNFGGIPIYSNLQGKLTYDLGNDTRINILGIAGDDKINIQPEPDAADFEQGEIDTVSYSHVINKNQQYTVGANLRKIWSEKIYSNFVLSRSYNEFFTNFNIDDKRISRQTGDELNISLLESADVYDNTSIERTTELKTEWNVLLDSKSELNFGAYSKAFTFDHEIISSPSSDTNQVGTPAQGNRVNFHQSLSPKFGGYASFNRWIGKRLHVNIGTRYDFFNLLESGNWSPRFGLSYRLNDKLTLNAATGVFHQRPEFIHITSDSLNQERLSIIRSAHYIAGMDYLLSEATLFSVEIYRKYYSNYPVSADPDYPFQSTMNSGASYGASFAANRLVSEGVGRASGIEVLLQKKLISGLYGLISYSFSNIEYKALDNIWRPGDFESEHVGNIVTGYRLNKNWEFSLKWRYASGRPYTPYDVEESIKAGAGRIDTDAINSARFNPYHRLDLRFDHRSFFQNFTLISYFSIENVYNRKNQNAVFWNSDQERPSFSYQTSFFPVGGFSLEF